MYETAFYLIGDSVCISSERVHGEGIGASWLI